MIIQSNRYYISTSSDGIYLNNQKFIDKKAELQFAVFNVLIDHYFYEIKNGTSFISPEKISKKLHTDFAISDISVAKINNVVYKIRNIFKKKFNISKPIIISEKWKGYRIADGIFFERKNR